MLPVFYHDFGRKGIWMAVFHSISAFCNAGFDILGTPENPFPSITAYAGNPIVNVVIMFLIIAGGIGFLTWEDICINKIHFRKYHMQSKIILVTTALLIVLPAVFFFFSDFTHLSVGKRLMATTQFAWKTFFMFSMCCRRFGNPFFRASRFSSLRPSFGHPP